MNQRHVSGQEPLNYRLRSHPGGVSLDLWETDPKASPGEASFRFFMTYELQSADDAQAILDNYLVTNEVIQAVPSHNHDVTPIHLRTLVGEPSLVS